MGRFLLIILIVVSLYGCTNETKALDALRSGGFQDIQLTGYRFFACSQDDFYHTGFTIVKDGRKLSGTVCSGIFFKGSTIRWD